VLEHIEQVRNDLQGVRRPPEQPDRGGEAPLAEVADRGLDLERGELQPELGGLVDGLKQELVPVRHLPRGLLERQQFVRAQVPLVVARARPREDRHVLVVGVGARAVPGRGLRDVGTRHTSSILRCRERSVLRRGQ
jgi:hypothetical protein